MSLTLGAAERERENLHERLLRTREPLMRFNKIAGFAEYTYRELTPHDQWPVFIRPLIEELLILTTPTLLEQQLPRQLAKLEEMFGMLNAKNEMTQPLKDIKAARLAQMLYCGDAESACNIIGISSFFPDKKCNPFEIALQLAEKIQGSPFQELVFSLIQQWQNIKSSQSTASIRVLLVTPSDPQWRSHGVLTLLELTRHKDAALNHFQFEHSTDQVDAALLSLDLGTRAASRWLSHELGYKNSASAVLKLRDISSTIEGPSLGLAIAGLCVCDGLIQSLSRKQLRFPETVALTGAIDEEGRVMPVEGIREKTVRVFYSPIEYFAVPAGQEREAEQVVAELNENDARRKLSIIPVRNLDDLLSQRRLLNDYQVPLPKHALRQLERFPRWAQVGLILLALAVLIYSPISYYYPTTRFWLDRTPVFWDAKSGQELKVMNKDGVVLWRFKTGNHWRTATDAEIAEDELLYIGAKSNEGMPNNRYCRFADINGDGKHEIFFLDPNRDDAKPPRDSEILYCLNDKGKILWKRVLNHPGYEPYVSKDTGEAMLASALRWIDIDWKKNGKSNLILSQRDASSKGSACAYLEEIDGRTGATLHIFKHIQWLFSLTAVTTEDGNREALWAGGLNNESAPELFIFQDSIRSRAWPCEDTTGFIGVRFPICDVYVNKEQAAWVISISPCDSNLVRIAICNMQVRQPSHDFRWKGYSFRIHQNLKWVGEEMIGDDWTQLMEFIRAGVIPMPDSPETWLEPLTYAEIWTGKVWVAADTIRHKPDPYPIYSGFDPRISKQ